MDSLPTIATELKKLREAKGMSVRKLSKESGVSPGYISQIENGSRQTPSPEMIKKLAKGLMVGEYFLLRKAGYLEEEELEEKEEIMNFEVDSSIANFLVMEVSTQAKDNFLEEKYRETGAEVFNPKNEESILESPDPIIKALTQNTIMSVRKGYSFLDEKTHFYLSYYSTIGDFLKILRFSKNKSVEESADFLNIEPERYLELEKAENASTIELYNEKISEFLEVGNFIEWHENIIDNDFAASRYKRIENNTQRTISFKVQSTVEKLDENGNKYIQNYSEEELKENFFNLSCLLNQTEHKVLYKNKVLTDSEVEKVKTMLEVLLED
ncbi:MULTISPECIES: helix-turn-helix domain-containing protein [unclassified Exiguobacterium]|uniref:helix-turn-helix domain-containing protein n=1 Tax=unclassified Exiguobacterium TaxID=2644629 RepID=UPI001BE8CDA3|nr:MULTISPECIES: helix-turn-helix domain-containing protein [unclassified Exiguobacterium]